MSIVFKYRVHEVAKDFKLQTKDITEIMTEYASTPKNHMQVLTEDELDIIFEYLTQHNQISSIEEIYAVSSPKPKPSRLHRRSQKSRPPRHHPPSPLLRSRRKRKKSLSSPDAYPRNAS